MRLAEVEEMTPTELHLHLAFLVLKADEERKAMKSDGGKWKTVSTLKR